MNLYNLLKKAIDLPLPFSKRLGFFFAINRYYIHNNFIRLAINTDTEEYKVILFGKTILEGCGKDDYKKLNKRIYRQDVKFWEEKLFIGYRYSIRDVNRFPHGKLETQYSLFKR